MTLHLFNEKIDEAVLPFGYKPPRLGVLAEPVYFSIFIHFKSVYIHERRKEYHKRCPAGWFLDCMAMQPRRVFSSKSHDCFEEKAGISFLFFPFITNDGLRPITNPIYTKKAVGHLPIRKRGSRSPIRTNRKYPPHIARSILLFHVRIWIFDFSLAQKSAKRFFSSKT